MGRDELSASFNDCYGQAFDMSGDIDVEFWRIVKGDLSWLL